MPIWPVQEVYRVLLARCFSFVLVVRGIESTPIGESGASRCVEMDSQLQAPKNLAFCTVLKGLFPLLSSVYVLCRL